MSTQNLTQTCRNLMAVLFVVAVLAMLLLLTGCRTIYHIERCEGTGAERVCVTAEIKSRREFAEGLAMKYNRESGTFEFSANQVTTHTTPLEEAAAKIILALPSLVAPTELE